MRFPALLCASVLAIPAAVVGQCSAFSNTPPGTNLLLLDESVHTVQLGFTFRFANATYDRITIADNGYVWLGAAPTNAATDFTPTAAEMLSQGPRLCVCWADLHPNSFLLQPGGGVFFRTDGTTANVVWKGVPMWFHQSVFANMEIVITSDTHPTNRNEIAFVYDGAMMPMNGTNIVGITMGNGAAAPPATQPPGLAWSAFVPGTVIGATSYQTFTAPSGASPFNLVGQTLRFVPVDPNTAVDFAVTSSALPACAPLPSYPPVATTPIAFGSGCPAVVAAGSIYESFTTNTGTAPFDLANTSIRFIRGGSTYTSIPGPGFDQSYTLLGVPQVLADDSMAGPLTLGTMGSFPFGTATVTTVNPCTNGFVWLNANTDTSFTPTPASLNSLGARLAPFWTDLNLNATTGGGAWFWENTDPNFCRVTWENAREFGQQATSANTFQVTLFANGDIDFSYAAMSGGVSHAIVVGLSAGGVTVDPGNSDLATSSVVNIITRTISPQDSMVHTLGGPCQLGLPFTMTSTVPAPLSGAGFFVVGYSSPSLPLDALGATGCTLYASLDNQFATSFASSPMTLTVTVPSTPSLGGLPLFSQAAALSPLNAFGIIGSNGMSFTVGI